MKPAALPTPVSRAFKHGGEPAADTYILLPSIFSLRRGKSEGQRTHRAQAHACLSWMGGQSVHSVVSATDRADFVP